MRKVRSQALGRTQNSLPIYSGRFGTMTLDDKRYGTAMLFAALSVTDGTLISHCQQRHQEWSWCL